MVFVDSWPESWVMVSIGYESAWNIPHQTCRMWYFLKCPKYIGFKYLTLNPNKLVSILWTYNMHVNVLAQRVGRLNEWAKDAIA